MTLMLLIHAQRMRGSSGSWRAHQRDRHSHRSDDAKLHAAKGSDQQPRHPDQPAKVRGGGRG